MGSPCSWGDNLTLQSIADTFDVVINLITDFADKNVIVIQPTVIQPTVIQPTVIQPTVIQPTGCQQPVGGIWLGFYAEFHYVSIEHLD
jgi:hypothetical protein